MTPKLIISSLVGVAAIGGGVAGGYYAFNSSSTKESTNKDTGQAKVKTEETSQSSTGRVEPVSPAPAQVPPPVTSNIETTSGSTTTSGTPKPVVSAQQPGNNGQLSS